MDGVLSAYWQGEEAGLVWGRRLKWEKMINYQKIIYNIWNIQYKNKIYNDIKEN